MGKRFIISMLLVVAIIGSIAAGSALFFQNRYHNLAEAHAEQSVAATQNIQDLAAAAGAALEQQPITGSWRKRSARCCLLPRRRLPATPG